MAARDKVLAARTALVMEAPFFGALALRLKLEEDPTCETAWTDGRSIGYSPAYVDSLQASELVALLAHEVMHVAAGHPWRRENRDPKRWNVATDYAVNGELQAAGFKLPEGALLNAQYTGKLSEWIYDRLPAPDPQAGNPQPGEVRDAPTDPDDDGQPAPTQADWQQAVQQAATVAKARGELSGSLERFAKAQARPAVDWRSVLHRFATETARADYAWSRPSSRYLARGLYLPGLHSTQVGRIAVAVDVSGSVDQVLLDQLAAELQAIVQELRPEAVDVLYCDTRIQRRESFGPDDLVQLSACGGGGTDFRPVFHELAEDPPVCLVYLTDMYGTFPREAPSFPTLWGALSDAVAPFGETVRVM